MIRLADDSVDEKEEEVEEEFIEPKKPRIREVYFHFQH